MIPGQTSTTPPAPGGSEQVDQICDRFEAAWLAGEQPRLEVYLSEVATSLRPQLLCELLSAQWDLCRQGGREVEIGSYLARFPEDGELVRRAYEKWGAEAGPISGTKTTAADQEHEVVTRRQYPVIPGYEIQSVLGRGGMGVVYKARHLRLKRLVALKMILAGEHAGLEDLSRFRTEAEVVARLQHPNIVPIYEFGEHADQQFFAMGFVEGPTLAEHLETHGPLPVDKAVELVERIARAVDYAHQMGIIHRDLKPANVLLDQDGKPHVADFGLAKCLDDDGDQTFSGQILGTPAYMAPEQAAGRAHQVDERSDVYALGTILYTAITAQPPFHADTTMDTLLLVLESEPDSPRTINPRVPKSLNLICLRCLEKRPVDRYRSAEALANELNRFREGEPLEVQAGLPLHRCRRWIRREPVLAAHLIAIMVIFALLHATWLVLGTGFADHLRNMSVLLTWAVTSFVLQALHRLDSCGRWVPHIWAVVDVVLLTCLLAWADPPVGPLLIGYPVLIAFFALFSRIRLVALMTAVTILSFVALLLLRPSWQLPAYHGLVFVVSLVVLAVIIGFQIRRLRVIGRHLGQRD